MWYHEYMKKLTSQNIATPLLIIFLSVWASVATIQYMLVKDKKPAVITVQPNETDVTATTMKPTIEYVNAIRAERGLPALKDDPQLDTSALNKAKDMLARNYYDHKDPTGQSFEKFILAQEPGLEEGGENIGRCYKNQDEVYAAFKNSPTHLANIVDPDFTLYGSAMVWNESKHCMYWVDHFGGY